MFATRSLSSCAVGLTVLALVGLSVPAPTAAQVESGVSPIGQVHHHIRLISPVTGPHGTEVRVWADGLQENQNYQIAIGEMQGCGYQICTPVRSNANGELVATAVVPEWAHTNHYEVVMILGEDFVPLAVSDPFHVSDADGLVTREGTIATAWPGCASLETEGGVTYALVGPRARTLLASQGHEMVIEGRIVEGTCTQQYAIEVVSMELVPERGG
jgi:hypothetical protein